MSDQISMFQLLDEYETPEIPLEEQKAGVKGWIIDISCICLKKNFCKEDWTGVETRPVVFLRDTTRTGTDSPGRTAKRPRVRIMDGTQGRREYSESGRAGRTA